MWAFRTDPVQKKNGFAVPACVPIPVPTQTEEKFLPGVAPSWSVKYKKPRMLGRQKEEIRTVACGNYCISVALGEALSLIAGSAGASIAGSAGVVLPGSVGSTTGLSCVDVCKSIPRSKKARRTLA